MGMLIDCPAFPSLVLAYISSKSLFSLVLVASIFTSLIGSGAYIAPVVTSKRYVNAFFV